MKKKKYFLALLTILMVLLGSMTALAASKSFKVQGKTYTLQSGKNSKLYVKQGSKKKLLVTMKNEDASYKGYYGSRILISSCRYDGGTFSVWAYNTKTRKLSRLGRNLEVARKSGKYALLAGSMMTAGPVPPLPYYVYNLSNGKKIRLGTRCLSWNYFSGKIYYTEVDKAGKYVYVKRCNMSGSGKRTIKKISASRCKVKSFNRYLGEFSAYPEKTYCEVMIVDRCVKVKY